MVRFTEYHVAIDRYVSTEDIGSHAGDVVPGEKILHAFPDAYDCAREIVTEPT